MKNNLFNRSVNTSNLRECQTECYKAILKHFSASGAEKDYLKTIKAVEKKLKGKKGGER